VGCALDHVRDGGVPGVCGFGISPKCRVFASVGEGFISSEQVGCLKVNRCILVPLALFYSRNGGVCLFVLQL
jgi:hypothetical protein